MTMLRDSRVIPFERTRTDADGPDEAYWMASGTANVYVLGTGAKAAEATAFLSDLGFNVFGPDDADEDRILLYSSSDNVVNC